MFAEKKWDLIKIGYIFIVLAYGLFYLLYQPIPKSSWIPTEVYATETVSFLNAENVAQSIDSIAFNSNKKIQWLASTIGIKELQGLNIFSALISLFVILAFTKFQKNWQVLIAFLLIPLSFFCSNIFGNWLLLPFVSGGLIILSRENFVIKPIPFGILSIGLIICSIIGISPEVIFVVSAFFIAQLFPMEAPKNLKYFFVGGFLLALGIALFQFFTGEPLRLNNTIFSLLLQYKINAFYLTVVLLVLSGILYKWRTEISKPLLILSIGLISLVMLNVENSIYLIPLGIILFSKAFHFSTLNNNLLSLMRSPVFFLAMLPLLGLFITSPVCLNSLNNKKLGLDIEYLNALSFVSRIDHSKILFHNMGVDYNDSFYQKNVSTVKKLWQSNVSDYPIYRSFYLKEYSWQPFLYENPSEILFLELRNENESNLQMFGNFLEGDAYKIVYHSEEEFVILMRE